jgi:hypothetical protein
MRVPFIRPALAAILLLVVATQPAAAAGKVSITIDVNQASGTELFTADGPFCDSGSATSGDFFFAGGGRAGTFHLQKILTCDDGSGTLTINVDAATANGADHDQGGWSVASGTGDYAGASGGGNIVGDYYQDGILDHYTGVLRS